MIRYAWYQVRYVSELGVYEFTGQYLETDGGEWVFSIKPIRPYVLRVNPDTMLYTMVAHRPEPEHPRRV